MVLIKFPQNQYLTVIKAGVSMEVSRGQFARSLGPLSAGCRYHDRGPPLLCPPDELHNSKSIFLNILFTYHNNYDEDNCFNSIRD